MMVRRPRRPAHEDEPVEELVEPAYDPEPAPEPVTPVTQEEPVPQPQQQSASGNGGVKPADIGGDVRTPSNTEQQAVIAAQMVLITAQAVVVRDLEDQLSLSPPLPSPPPGPPATGVILQNVIDAQTAAIRTQAAYIKHLEDIEMALVPPGP